MLKPTKKILKYEKDQYKIPNFFRVGILMLKMKGQYDLFIKNAMNIDHKTYSRLKREFLSGKTRNEKQGRKPLLTPMIIL